MSKQYPHFGEVVNGLMWDGSEWVPVDGLKPGDVIGEMMWTGTHWVPINPRPASKPDRPLWKKWWFILIVAFTFLTAVGMITGPDEPRPMTPDTVNNSEEEPYPGLPGVDDPVVDGDLEFTVTDVDVNASKIPGTFNQVYEAQGSFTLVEMTIKNVGDNPAPVRPDHIEGTVDGGAEIPSNWVGTYYANPTGQAGPFVRDVNPGAKIEVTIVFDVPDGMSLQTVVCHDAVFSDGAVITL